MRAVIRAPSRLHFSLCDLCPVSNYEVGGFGIGIDYPNLQVSCRQGEGKRVLSGTAMGLTEQIHERLAKLKSQVEVDALDLEIDSNIPMHSGFGSHTAVALAVVEAVNIVSGSGWTREQLIDLSGRGGTSGVGIQTYFRGGVAYDFGRVAASASFRPSSKVEVSRLPVFGPRIHFPSDWKVLLGLPSGLGVHGEDELDFFRAHTPLGEDEALRAISCIHHGVVPAFISADLATLAKALERLHRVGFKAFELENQPRHVQDFYHQLSERGMACGMSSFGPLVYCILHSSDVAACKLFGEIADAFGSRTMPTNVSAGRQVYLR